ncbi:MAG: hypothetical protein KAK00_08805, partial [Nanoarchaeota archaeon]|nr:hypothetical protein [Nanoarchaeota archaeon]
MMQKEGKVDIKVFLTVSILMVVFWAIFVLADGAEVTLTNPVDGYNSSSLDVILNCTPIAVGEVNISNVTLWIDFSGIFAPNGTDTSGAALNNSNVSFARTAPSDGTYVWNCYACDNNSVCNFSTSNRTVTVDTTAPVVNASRPGTFNIDNLNFTQFPVTVNVTVGDSGIGIEKVWYILNSGFSTGGGPNLLGGNDTAVEMTGANGKYSANLSVSFTSLYTGPGPHSIYFCANDSFGHVACNTNLNGAPAGFMMKGANVTEVEASMAAISGVSSANITYENGTDFSGMADPTSNIYTMRLNLNGKFVTIVGFQINESLMRDMNQTDIVTNPTTQIEQAIGSGYNLTMAWANVSIWLPTGSFYKYGIFELPGTGFDRMEYCTGHIDDPTCTAKPMCNATPTVSTYENVNMPCWIESNGYTLLYSTSFSGGVGGNDTTAPQVIIGAPVNGINTSDNTPQIYVTISDINGSGINNASTNVNVNGTIYNLNQMTCTNNTLNSTNTSCYFDASTLSDGLINLTVTAIDSSNNTNTNITTIFFTVDATAPVLNYNASSASSAAVGTVITISANFTDATTNVDSLILLVNGTPKTINQSCNYNTQLVTFNYTVQTGEENKDLNFTVRVNDSAGNLAETETKVVAVTDSTAPTVSLSVPVAGKNTSSSNVTFTFTTTDAVSSTVNCTLVIDDVVNVTYDSTSTGNTTTINYFNDGSYLWNVTCEDAAGNINNSPTRIFTVDTVAPTIYYNASSATSAAVGDIVTITATFNETRTNVDALVFKVNTTIKTVNQSFNYKDTQVTFNYTIQSADENKVLAFTVTANDSAGNENTTSSFEVT